MDLSGSSFSKQFKKANKLKSKSIIVIGDDEAANGEFIIRLFDQSDNRLSRGLGDVYKRQPIT